MQRSPESARMTGNGTVFPQMLNLKPETSLYTLVGYHCHITVGITFTHDINVQKHFVEQQGKAFGPYSESITNELSWKKFWNKTLNSDWFFRRASKLQSAAAQISVRILLLKPSVLSGLSALSPTLPAVDHLGTKGVSCLKREKHCPSVFTEYDSGHTALCPLLTMKRRRTHSSSTGRGKAMRGRQGTGRELPYPDLTSEGYLTSL